MQNRHIVPLLKCVSLGKRKAMTSTKVIPGDIWGKSRKPVGLSSYQMRNAFINCTPFLSPHLLFCFSLSTLGNGEGTLVSPVGPDELPPPYTPSSSGVPMVTCRVCQAMIDISGKVDQHVVKCSQCNEATVSGIKVVLCC